MLRYSLTYELKMTRPKRGSGLLLPIVSVVGIKIGTGFRLQPLEERQRVAAAHFEALIMGGAEGANFLADQFAS